MLCQWAGRGLYSQSDAWGNIFCLLIAQSHAQSQFPHPSLIKPLARRSFFTLPATNEGNHTDHTENERPHRHRRPFLDLAATTVLIILDEPDRRLNAFIRFLANTIEAGFIFAACAA